MQHCAFERHVALRDCYHVLAFRGYTKHSVSITGASEACRCHLRVRGEHYQTAETQQMLQHKWYNFQEGHQGVEMVHAASDFVCSTAHTWDRQDLVSSRGEQLPQPACFCELELYLYAKFWNARAFKRPRIQNDHVFKTTTYSGFP